MWMKRRIAHNVGYAIVVVMKRADKNFMCLTVTSTVISFCFGLDTYQRKRSS